ncbi:phosphoglycerate mutase family protein [Pseudohyphozyma bogoriensis]|nr:phosphoglycerate mutase family protein [Pseudohyphozyma bogoriensis]
MTSKHIYFTRLLDAPLTPLGRKQSRALNEDTKDTFQKTAELLVTSALRRPMQTMLDGYPGLVERMGKANVVVLPQLQECNGYPCDTGSPKADLEANPEFAGLDFSSLTPDWTSKKGIYDPENVLERAKWCRKWLRERDEKVIVVVAHGDILRAITDGWRSDTPWANAEVKEYTFSSDDDEEATVVPIRLVTREGGDAPTSSGK